jgi:hypothetical protein
VAKLGQCFICSYDNLNSCSGTDCFLDEKWCGESGLDGEADEFIFCPNGCSNGACVREMKYDCNDTDPNNDPYLRGSCFSCSPSIPNPSYQENNQPVPDSCGGVWDTCLSNVRLRQCSCSANGTKIDYFDCPYECSNGACLGKDTTCTPKYYCEISPNICPSSGIQTKTCNDIACDEKSYTEQIACNPGQCSGCELDGKCIPYGFRVGLNSLNNIPGNYNLYCDIDGELEKQKTVDSQGNWATCQNNYECESNVCSSGECIEVQKMLDQASALKKVAIRFWCTFARISSDVDYDSCIAELLG